MNQTLLALSLLLTAAAPVPSHAAPVPVSGATPTLLAPPLSAPPTLDAALHAMRPLQEDVALAVGAEKVSLPKDALAPDPDAAPDDVAEAYGVLTQSFGPVLAVAPRTMTVVYAPPATPNPYDGMPPGQVLKMLARTFTPAQWRAFMSDAGVAYAAMQEGAQQALFQALFPNGHLVALLDSATGPNDPAAKRDISGDDLLQAHLRLGYIVSIALPVVGQPGTHRFANSWKPPDSPPLYFMMNNESRNIDHEYSATVRETLPNVPKPSALPTSPNTAAVPLGGLKTVSDLLARISALSHCEIYADPRYGVRSVTLVGKRMSASGGSLLQALALCVRGTYRKVGPLYVLTDDALGLGTKHALWKAFEEKASTMLPGHGQFGEWLPIEGVPFTRKDLSFRDAPLALTPAQQTLYWKKQDTGFGGDMMQLYLPLDQLTPAQQESAQHIQADNEKEHANTSLDGNIMLQAEPELQIVLPTLPGPVIVFQSYQNLLPDPARSPADEAAQRKQMETIFPAPPPAPRVPAPPGTLQRMLSGFTRRAVRLAPANASALSRDLACAHALGFNEVWLPFMPDAPAPALLAQAVQEGRPLGIAILPELSVLRWHEVPPPLQDIDILGRTPQQADAQAPSHMADVHDTVTPFDPTVQERLQSSMATLAAVPGIGGLVLEDFAPPGYTSEEHSMEDPYNPALGYAEAGRVAFLRAAHADPVDLYNNSFTDVRAHVQVPDFDEDDFAATQALFAHWRKFRSRAAAALAQSLLRALPGSFQGASSRLPVLVPPANSAFSTLYGSWDNWQDNPPIVQYISPTGPDGMPVMGMPATERMASRLQYRVVQFYALPNASGPEVLHMVLFALQQPQKSGVHSILMNATNPSLLETLAQADSAPTVTPPSVNAH